MLYIINAITMRDRDHHASLSEADLVEVLVKCLCEIVV